LLPAFDSGQDAFWVSLPDEGFRFPVVFGEVAVESSLEVDDGVEHATFEPSLGERGEEALDGIDPGAGGRREVEDEARMPAEPLQDLGCL
jgi:hypothetical protein